MQCRYLCRFVGFNVFKMHISQDLNRFIAKEPKTGMINSLFCNVSLFQESKKKGDANIDTYKLSLHNVIIELNLHIH